MPPGPKPIHQNGKVGIVVDDLAVVDAHGDVLVRVPRDELVKVLDPELGSFDGAVVRCLGRFHVVDRCRRSPPPVM